MSFLTKSLLIMFGCILCFGIASLGLTSSVEYKPYGVPDHRREEYDNKVAKLEDLATRARAPGAKARARVPEKHYSFGMLDPHSTASHSFEVENIGEAPLEIKVMDSSCKCTVGEAQQRFVEPGKKSQVTLTWNTGYKAEEYKQSVSLWTNDPHRENITLEVSGEVRAECVAPQSIVFGACKWGENASAEIVVYSQLWEDFEITDVQCDLNDFGWFVEPIENHDVSLQGEEARSAWKIKVWSFRQKFGRYASDITVNIQPVGGKEPIVKTIAATGKVKPPISFYSPEIHNTEGLDIGTMAAGKKHSFHVITRVRGADERQIEVLDVKPDEIHAELTPTQQDGNYRLSIVIPEDCPTVVFNRDSKHGYVQVGDPEDKEFSNWFPIRGAVLELPQ